MSIDIVLTWFLPSLGNNSIDITSCAAIYAFFFGNVASVPWKVIFVVFYESLGGHFLKLSVIFY